MAEQTPIPQPGAAAQMPITVDPSTVTTIYTNVCRSSFTPEELILDLGLQTGVDPSLGEPVRLTHRIVMSFYTAKKLMLLLNDVVQHHENLFGPLELDVEKRIRARAPTQKRS